MKTIALLTDFGVTDPYVGMMKGVVLSLAPNVTLLDSTHGIPPQDVRAGAFWLGASHRYFPRGTIHVAVVDPGVGSERKALVLATESGFFLGPDNGLFDEILGNEAIRFAFALDRCRVDELARARDFSTERRGRTFDGRDLFAKAAALLALGIECFEFGSEVRIGELVRLERPENHDEIVIVVADHFGNLISDRKWPTSRDPRVIVHGRLVRWVETYADAEDGELVVLRSSAGTLEIAVRGGNAKTETRLGPGARLRLAPEEIAGI